MKKRVRILVSLLMISGSLTLASKSYASHRGPNAYCLTTLGGAGVLAIGASMLAANRRANKMYVLSQFMVGVAGLATVVWGSVCALTEAYAAEIIEDPSLALQNNKEFSSLAESVGIDEALFAVSRINDGESREEVAQSVILLLEQNSNNNDSFLDAGHEEDIEVQ